MNDLKRLYQKPVTTQIKELKGNVSEDYDTLEEVAQAATNIPVASAQTLGGVKVGENLSITEEGVLSASGGGAHPLIVEGSVSTDVFTPRTGQPTQSDAIAAFIAGRPVILSYDYDGMEGNYALINSFDGTEYVLIAYIYSGKISW